MIFVYKCYYRLARFKYSG